MFLVYYIAMVTVGSAATDWANDGLFGDGFHLFGIGTSAYEEVADEYGDSDEIIAAYVESLGSKGEAIADAIDTEAEDYDSEDAVKALTTLKSMVKSSDTVDYSVEDEETLATEDFTADADDIKEAIDLAIEYDGTAPDPADYGVWVPGIPVLIEDGLDAIGCADWLKGLILDGIVAGVGAVLGFVPQMLVLFLLLAILEACGYMARIAFIMDRIFRRFGLSGKSFIPILIGTGCGVPGIMASRTIENERDRRMTIMTTTFIPCGAKTPFIAMIAGAIFGGSPWVATSAYFIGMAAMTGSEITIKDVSYENLGIIPDSFRRLGIRVEQRNDDIFVPAQEHYQIETFLDGSIMTIADAPWPGLTPDLLSVMLVVATQAKGSVLIHQKMFESRLFFVDKLIDMGAQIILCDPHRAVVIGHDRGFCLRGGNMTSPDIRAGIALLIAALGAEGISRIHNIEQIDRGYQNIEQRLTALGARITRIE